MTAKAGQGQEQSMLLLAIKAKTKAKDCMKLHAKFLTPPQKLNCAFSFI